MLKETLAMSQEATDPMSHCNIDTENINLAFGRKALAAMKAELEAVTTELE